MKQLKMITGIVIILTIVTAVFVVCKKTNKQNKINSNVIMKNLDNKRVLVLFFSRAGDNYKVGYVKKGNTKFLAEYIVEMTGGDVFEITAKKNYDISYEKMLEVVREEFENGESPEFNGKIDDISQYDVVFVGGPIWWGTYPMVMFTFFKEYDLNGKILIPFTTNEGSGLGNTQIDLQKMYPEATVLNGFTMTGQEARKPEAYQAVEQWLAQLEYKKITTAGESHKVDGATGATKTNKPLTPKGKEYEKQKEMLLEVEFQDGQRKKMELVVQGTVDMGIGTLWGAANLDAAILWETGSHYAWGETEPKERYTEDNYAYYHRATGNDINKTWYDAAQTRLGGGGGKIGECRLKKNGTNYLILHGMNGYLFKANRGISLLRRMELVYFFRGMAISTTGKLELPTRDITGLLHFQTLTMRMYPICLQIHGVSVITVGTLV
jgi:flavodoxin